MLPQTHSESLAVQLASGEIGEEPGKTRRENEEREREEHAKEVEELRGEVFALNAKVKRLLTSCWTLKFCMLFLQVPYTVTMNVFRSL